MDGQSVSEPESELVEINLNNSGEDFTVIVPLGVANILLNDPDAATNFINQLVAQNQMEQSNRNDTAETLNLEKSSEKEQDDQRNKFVWSNKKPTLTDIEATKLFLNLRQDYCNKFNDKKTVKSQLWHLIANKMNIAGYNVGEGRDAIEKCRMKFANLQKQYLQHVKHMNTTAESKKTEPPFFDEMHGILGGKDKVNPKHTQDTIDSDEASTSCDVSDAPTDEKENNLETGSRNRFKCERSVRPKSSNAVLTELIKQQHEETMKR